jgi:hypothetical protein
MKSKKSINVWISSKRSLPLSFIGILFRNALYKRLSKKCILFSISEIGIHASHREAHKREGEDFLHTAGQAGAEGRFLTKPVTTMRVFDMKTGSLYEAIQEINKMLP